LLLPHPGTPDRATVLIPWLDIEPAAVLPGRGPIVEVMAGLSADVVRRRDDLRLEW
jgi:2-amino-4-hydroxy-6-hydroxymethyldihydropteridine diphosphokinase